MYIANKVHEMNACLWHSSETRQAEDQVFFIVGSEGKRVIFKGMRADFKEILGGNKVMWEKNVSMLSIPLSRE